MTADSGHRGGVGYVGQLDDGVGGWWRDYG